MHIHVSRHLSAHLLDMIVHPQKGGCADPSRKTGGAVPLCVKLQRKITLPVFEQQRVSYRLLKLYQNGVELLSA